MFAFPGYRTLSLVHQSVHSMTLRARREADDLPVVLKVLKEEYPPPQELKRYHKEFEIARELGDRPGIIRVLGLEKAHNRLVMIVEDFGGVSLQTLAAKTPFSVEKVLEIGIGVAACLAELHAARIIHKDINPANILYNPDTGEIKIIDFGISTRLPREMARFERPEMIEGTLAYTSPEQTGRLNRPLDFRSDYYSFGATLYELLTGRLPFEVEDRHRMMLCHLTEIPIPAHRARPDLPQAVSDIVTKLLEKDPERRYQSALGILTDLAKCLKGLRETGRVDPFPLGERDLSDRLLVPQKLYGRDQELASLLDGFERVSQGGREWMLISGYSGIGKSTLVRSVYLPLTQKQGTILSGKFSQMEQNRPYGGLIDAIGQLGKRLLCESDERLEVFRTRLAQALCENGQVILDILPEFAVIIGPQPLPPALPPEERKNRFHKLFERFVGVFATKDHPLVIFLDDLQWADHGTFQLIHKLLGSTEIESLYLIGAYRDNEIHPAHPLLLTLQELEGERCLVSQLSLRPLGLADVAQLVRETLRDSRGESDSLAALLWQKSEGNPFLLHELMEALHVEGLLTADLRIGQWCWDLERIRAHGVTDNTAELLVRKIQRMAPETQQLLGLASCLGNQFDLLTLALLEEKPPEDLEPTLRPALESGLLVPQAAETMEYKFAHDRLQQAAYAMVPEQERGALHGRIGRLLLEIYPPENNDARLFDIVNQLNRAIGFITTQLERDELARLNLLAGKKAQASSAYAPALHYLATGVLLLGQDGWQRQYELTLSLHEEAAEAAYLCKDFQRMNQWTELVLGQARTVLEKVRAHQIRINAFAAEGKPEESVKSGLVSLAELGFPFPARPGKARLLLALLQTKLALFGTTREQILALGNLSDPVPRAAIQIMRAMAVPVFMTNSKLMALLLFSQVRLVVRHGHSQFSPSIFASYGIVLCGILGDLDRGYQMGKLALELLEKNHERFLRSRITYTVNIFEIHHKEHLANTLAPLKQGFQLGLEVGDFESAALNALFYCQHSFFLGQELSAFEKELAYYSEALRALHQHTLLDMTRIYHQSVLNLLGRALDPGRLSGEAGDEARWQEDMLQRNDQSGLIVLFYSEMYLFYLFGRFEQAYETALKVDRYKAAATSMFGQKRVVFLESLSLLRVFAERSRADRRMILAKVRVNLKMLRKWARHAPMNHQHMVALVEAERLRTQGKSEKAEGQYARAVQLAKHNGFLQDEALANELAGEFCLSLRKLKIAQEYFREAHYAYRKWGARAKVDNLEAAHPDLIGHA